MTVHSPSLSPTRVAWFEYLAAPAAVALLEATWLSLWLTWLGRLPAFLPQTGGALLPFWIAAALVLGGHTAGRLALAANVAPPGASRPANRGGGRKASTAEMRRARLIVAGLGLLAVAGALWTVYGRGLPIWSPRWVTDYAVALARSWQPVPPQALSLAAAMYLWRRGLKAGQTSAAETHDDLRRTFYGGLAGLALAVLVAAPDPGRNWPTLEAGEIGRAALVYFATGLSALAMASAQRALRQGQQVANSQVTLNRYWLGAAAGVVLFVLLGGLAAGWLVTPEPIRAIFETLTPVVHFIGAALLFVFAIVATITLLIAQLIVPLIWRLIQLLTALPLANMPPMQPPTLEQLTEQVNQFMDRVPAARLALNVLAVVLLLGGIGFIFWLALDRLGRRHGAGDDEERESIASRALIAAQLSGLLNRLRPRRPGAAPYLRLDGPPLDPRLVIRLAYQAMLAWAAETLQEPRAPAQTPDAYARRLIARTPQASPALGVLTSAYLKARYSPHAPSAAEADAARQAAAEIRRIRIES